MEGNTIIIVLALATLVGFLLGAAFDRWHVRKAWKRDEKTTLGVKEEQRRAEQGMNP